MLMSCRVFNITQRAWRGWQLESDKSENKPDHIVPDDGEELDNDIYAEEGYGAL